MQRERRRLSSYEEQSAKNREKLKNLEKQIAELEREQAKLANEGVQGFFFFLLIKTHSPSVLIKSRKQIENFDKFKRHLLYQSEYVKKKKIFFVFFKYMQNLNLIVHVGIEIDLVL